MAWKELAFNLKSSCPLMVANVQTANPLNKFAKATKAITDKKKKTDADYELLYHTQFMGALYLNERGPCIPSSWIEGTLIEAAKTDRAGKLAKSGMYSEDTFDLQYDGPRDAEGLYADDRFRDIRPIKSGSGSRPMCCRPIFPQWEAVVKVMFDDAILNASQVHKWMEIAGQQRAIGTYRPRYGRFTVAA